MRYEQNHHCDLCLVKTMDIRGTRLVINPSIRPGIRPNVK